MDKMCNGSVTNISKKSRCFIFIAVHFIIIFLYPALTGSLICMHTKDTNGSIHINMKLHTDIACNCMSNTNASMNSSCAVPNHLLE